MVPAMPSARPRNESTEGPEEGEVQNETELVTEPQMNQGRSGDGDKDPKKLRRWIYIYLNLSVILSTEFSNSN